MFALFDFLTRNNHARSPLVFLGTTSRGRDTEVTTLRSAALQHLLHLINQMTHQSHDLESLGLLDKSSGALEGVVKLTPEAFCIWPYSIGRGDYLMWPWSNTVILTLLHSYIDLFYYVGCWSYGYRILWKYQSYKLLFSAQFFRIWTFRNVFVL